MADLPPILLAGVTQDVPPATINITEDDLMQVVGDFLKLILGTTFQVVRGQDNRVPMPLSKNFAVITSGVRRQLSTSRHDDQPDIGLVVVDRPTAAQVQIDIYGPNSTDNGQVVTTLLRDAYGCRAMDGTGVQPLYCEDAIQMPLIDGEKQYEQRRMIASWFQINPAVSTQAQFADSVAVVIEKAD